MKAYGLRAATVFLISTLVIGAMIVGFFFLSGGELSHDVDATPLPEQPVRVVIIDAGHGGEDGGAVGVTGLLEKDLNLDIAKKLESLLTKNGYSVIMTRTEDVLLYDRSAAYKGRKKALDLAARQAIGDQYPNAIFVSIHANAFSEQIYHGLQIWYSPNHASSARLAQEIRGAVVGSLQPENHRQSKAAGSNIYLLYHLKSPAVLVECGFLSNPAECRALEDETYRQELALALYRGIAAYYESDAVTKEEKT